MLQSLRVLKNQGDEAIPDFMEFEARFSVGETMLIRYDWKNKISRIGYSAYQTAVLNEGVTSITVEDVVVNTLSKEYRAMYFVRCDDTVFQTRCGCKNFAVFEDELEGRLI